MMTMPMLMRPPLHRDFETEEQRWRAERDLEGTELTLIEAGMVGLGGSALLVSGTGRKMKLTVGSFEVQTVTDCIYIRAIQMKEMTEGGW
jgi:hypothetical protein